ncbi:MAG: 30S ribosomal protein S6 [Oscillospiraceae bacterium]|jgi:small subunit ribosomal protein S6|nr:30S ribosomal protein S6 [Oscillospiraceae bacterium]
MAQTTGTYETIFLMSTASGEEPVKALIEKFTNLISQHGTVDSVDDWGKRRLAYPINDEVEGYYYLINFTSAPDFPAELDRMYKITDGILRTIIVRREAA